MVSDTFERNAERIVGQGPVVVADTADVADESGMTVLDLLMAVRKHWFTAVLTFIIAFAAVAGYTFSQTKMYTATAQLFASYNNASESGAASGGSNYTQVGTQSVAGSYIANQLKSYPDLVKTSAVLKPVAAKQDADGLSVGAISGMVTATNPENTYMLNLSVTSADPALAADLANDVAQSLSDVVASELYSSGSKSIVKLSVVQEATKPSSPSSPNTRLNLLAGAAIGLIFAIIAAVLRDLLSRRVQGTSDLRAIAGHASILGIVPKSDELSDNSKPIIIASTSDGLSEEFRRIRTNLSFITSREEDKGRLIVVSSAMPHEGKTTVSVNMAVAFAENGASVLLIDADLRHPTVAKRLGLEGNVGLAHVLSKQAGVKDVVQQYWKPNLHIMPAGPHIQNASVLLNSGLMTELIKQAVQQYDYVIIDTTPMSVANDAAVFAQLANGVVLVSCKGLTFKNALRDTVDELRELHVPILGFVFNQSDEKLSRGYGYYYYYGDGEHSRGSRRLGRSQRAKGKRR